MEKWFRRLPERWAHEQSIAQRFMEDYQSYIDDDGLATIVGTYVLLSRHGHEWGRFRIRIVYPDAFPARNAIPNVFLVSHRNTWQNLRDSHIEATWRMCLFVPGEAHIYPVLPDSLERLFQDIHSFLSRERIYQRRLAEELSGGPKAEWPGPDRAHGDEGLWQVVRERRPGRNAPCICGSAKKYKKCCMVRLEG